MTSGRSSQNRVELSMSVNRNVTVPDGVTMPGPHCRPPTTHSDPPTIDPTSPNTCRYAPSTRPTEDSHPPPAAGWADGVPDGGTRDGVADPAFSGRVGNRLESTRYRRAESVANHRISGDVEHVGCPTMFADHGRIP